MDEEEISGSGVEPEAEKLVEFYEDSIPVARLADGSLYVPLRPISEALGLNFASQRKRVLRDDVMAESISYVKMLGADGRRRVMMAIPLQHLPGWLFGVDTNKIRAELRDKLLRYKRESFGALWKALQPEMTPALLPAPVSQARQMLEQATIIYQLAQQQVEFEERIAGVEQRQDVMAEYMRGFIVDTRNRLEGLEERFDPEAAISEAEAAEIALAVKNVAAALEAKHGSSSYGKVYGEMYRRYGIRSYRVLPRKSYDVVLAWLHRWHNEVAADQSKLEGSAA